MSDRKILDYLEQLDLSDIEAKMYLRLLETGPISVRELAKKVGVNRTASYVYIDQLIEKGLLIKIVKGSQNQVAANPPGESIQHLIEKKAAVVKTAQDKFPDMLQIITNSFPSQVKTSEDAEIKYYKGKFGIKKIYEDALQANELRSYVNIAEIGEVFPENFELFDNALKQNPEMKMFEVVEDSPQARKRIGTSSKIEKYFSKRERYFYKLLPEGMKLSAQDILIYENRVAIIGFKGTIHGIILYNTDLYNNFKLLFDFVWRMLPE